MSAALKKTAPEPFVDLLVARLKEFPERRTPAGYHYKSNLEFVVHHGRGFEFHPFTFEDRLYVRSCVERAGFRPRMGQCYGNSRRTLVRGDTERRLTYVEGFLRARYFIMHHGWLLLDGTKLADVTLDAAGFGLKLLMPREERRHGPMGPYYHEPADYFGVSFTREYVLAADWQSEFGFSAYAPDYTCETLREPWAAVSESEMIEETPNS